MIALAQINTENFTFVAVLSFKILSCKVLFINRKDIKNSFNYAKFYENSKFHK